LPQDESTIQSNDGPKASWVPNGEVRAQAYIRNSVTISCLKSFVA
jgi:hypothetical protein